MSRYMRAYYHTFTPTGNDDIDAILEAVAVAGKSFHNTSQWDDSEPSHWDLIQQAADKAALAVLAQKPPEDFKPCPKCGAPFATDAEISACPGDAQYLPRERK